MATKTKASVYVIEATEEAQKLGFLTGECYRCEFLDPEYNGQEGHFFDQVESYAATWLPLYRLVRTGSTIKYKIND